MRRSGLLLLMLGALAGCGEEKATLAEGEQAARVAEEYYDALARSDTKAACAKLGSEVLESSGGSAHCADEIIGPLSSVPDEIREDLANSRAKVVAIDGGRITIEVTSSGKFASGPRSQRFWMEREDDEWRITDRPESPGPDPVTTCMVGGLEAYDRGEADAFWRREDHADFVYYLQQVCRRVTKDPDGGKAELRRAQRLVLQEMIRDHRIDVP
jgi:hypothetical protein